MIKCIIYVSNTSIFGLISIFGSFDINFGLKSLLKIVLLSRGIKLQSIFRYGINTIDAEHRILAISHGERIKLGLKLVEPLGKPEIQVLVLKHAPNSKFDNGVFPISSLLKGLNHDPGNAITNVLVGVENQYYHADAG